MTISNCKLRSARRVRRPPLSYDFSATSLISVIAKLRAKSRREELPMRNSECPSSAVALLRRVDGVRSTLICRCFHLRRTPAGPVGSTRYVASRKAMSCHHTSKTLCEPGSAHDQLARVGDCAWVDRPKLMGQQRDDRNRLAVQRGEFDFVTRRFAMHQHHRANVASIQTVFGQVARQYHVVQFSDHTVSFFFSG